MSKTIMTADDSASMRQMIRITLLRGGFQVIEAPDGARAAELLRQEQVDLLITDLNMPGVDGIGLIKIVRSMPRYRFLPILMLTTENLQNKKDEGKQAGASGWIVKPFQTEQLIKAVQRLLPGA